MKLHERLVHKVIGDTMIENPELPSSRTSKDLIIVTYWKSKAKTSLRSCDTKNINCLRVLRFENAQNLKCIKLNYFAMSTVAREDKERTKTFNRIETDANVVVQK